MANADRPNGARPRGPLLRVRPYVAGAACYPGDFVTLSADGKVDPASAGGAILGVAVSYASAADAEVLVADHPDQLYIVQADSTEIDAQTDIGNTADILATAGNTTYNVSRMELDSSTQGTGAGQLLILGIDTRADNALGTNVDCVVMISEHQLDSITDVGV